MTPEINLADFGKITLGARLDELNCDCGRWVRMPHRGETVECKCGTKFERRSEKEQARCDFVSAGGDPDMFEAGWAEYQGHPPLENEEELFATIEALPDEFTQAQFEQEFERQTHPEEFVEDSELDEVEPRLEKDIPPQEGRPADRWE